MVKSSKNVLLFAKTVVPLHRQKETSGETPQSSETLEKMIVLG